LGHSSSALNVVQVNVAKTCQSVSGQEAANDVCLSWSSDQTACFILLPNLLALVETL